MNAYLVTSLTLNKLNKYDKIIILCKNEELAIQKSGFSRCEVKKIASARDYLGHEKQYQKIYL